MPTTDTLSLFAPIALAGRADTATRPLLMTEVLKAMQGTSAPELPASLKASLRDLTALLPPEPCRSLSKQEVTLDLPLPEAEEEGFVEIEYQLAGEWFPVMGEVRCRQGRFFLRLSTDQYRQAGKKVPAALYTEYVLTRLGVQSLERKALHFEYPPSLLLRAVQVCRRRQNVRSPYAYIRAVLDAWREDAA